MKRKFCFRSSSSLPTLISCQLITPPLIFHLMREGSSISDIFGATAERLVRRSTKTKVWLIGEKIVRASFKALRNMENPPEYSQPDHYSERYQGDEDSKFQSATALLYFTTLATFLQLRTFLLDQGVHANSGIISKAFVLMVQGGVHPVSKIDVPPLNPSFDESILEAAKIFYDANTKCLSESSNFLMARQCTLMFASSEQADTVSKAWDAVGVEEQESSTTCKGRGEFCSVRDDCCGKRLTCGGQDDNRTCKKCRRRNQSCTVSESCCEGLKCESSMCVSVRL
jgi:thermolysin